MAERRSMNQALTLSPEKVAFIHHGSSPDDANQRKDAASDSDATNKEASSRSTADHSQLNEPLVSSTDIPPVLVPLTTRLLPDTAEALRRAHLEQKLRRRSPSTQQEIVEEAVCRWLTEKGYK